MAAPPKYPRPKILAADLDDSVVEHLRDRGFNVERGTFGQAFEVTRSSEYYGLPPFPGKLPNYTEQEVVLVDLTIGLLA